MISSLLASSIRIYLSPMSPIPVSRVFHSSISRAVFGSCYTSHKAIDQFSKTFSENTSCNQFYFLGRSPHGEVLGNDEIYFQFKRSGKTFVPSLEHCENFVKKLTGSSIFGVDKIKTDFGAGKISLANKIPIKPTSNWR